MKKSATLVITFLILVVSALILVVVNSSLSQTPNSKPDDKGIKSNDEKPSDTKAVEITLDKVIAQNLDTPWELAFLPNGDILFTERNGNLKKISNETKTIAQIQGVLETSEGGLMGLAIHPNFNENQLIYIYYTYQQDGNYFNRVERYKLQNDTLVDKQTILSQIPGSNNHDGGRIKFGPDKYLYIATGDAQTEQLAQNKDSLAGKILRITDNGKVPNNNPFGNEVFSYGHRNPQGIAWDSNQNLWSTEHGPSGLSSGYDEVNLVKKGQNYGWPIVRGDETSDGMTSPVLQSGSSDTWAPSGLAYKDGVLFFVGLRGQAIYSLDTNQQDPVLLEHFKNEFGRLRAISLGPDGALYVSTSNRDGRGRSNEGDDKILKFIIK